MSVTTIERVKCGSWLAFGQRNCRGPRESPCRLSRALDRVEKAEELLVAATFRALHNCRPSEHVDAGEERGRAVAFERA